MGIGVSVFLLAVGAILAFAITDTIYGVDLTTVGYILMVYGAIGLALASLVFGRRGRVGAAGTVAEERIVTRERDVI